MLDVHRRLFTVLAALSLFLCLTTVALCWQSYGRNGLTALGAPGSVRSGIRSSDGRIVLARAHLSGKAVSEDAWMGYILSWRRGNGSHGDVTAAFGFDWYDEKPGAGNLLMGAGLHSFRVLSLPYWPPIILFAIAPLLWIRAEVRRRRRLASMQCPHCGYDLRATPDRCPECGHSP